MSIDNALSWIEPPIRQTPIAKYANIIAELQTHPGQWARIATGRSSGGMAYGFVRGRKKYLEAVSRVNDKNTHDIYARYTGTETTLPKGVKR